MFTRCPYPNCNRVFEIDSDNFSQGSCEACLRKITYRELALLSKLDERESRLLSSNTEIPEAKDLVVLVEDVRSLWNVGSIFRTCDGAGFEAIYLCGITGHPPRKEIAKTSLGAEDTIKWCYRASSLATVLQLKNAGYQIVALEKLSASIDLTNALTSQQITLPSCLIVGNEVTGVSSELLAHSDLVCHLPMRGMKESLNVAVAFGIAAYQIAEALIKRSPVPFEVPAAT